MPAPILVLKSADPDDSDRPLLTLDQAKLTQGFWTSSVPDGFATSVQIYASGSRPGLLMPGDKVRVPVYYAGLQQPWDFNDTSVELEVRVHAAGNPEAIDWAAMKPTLKPATMDAETWDAVFGNLTAMVGPTWGDYVRRLGELGAALDCLGRTVTNVSDLFAFQARLANGLPAAKTVAGAVDAAVPGPGMAVTFGRSFGNTIAERYRVGPFGRGWAPGWDVRAETLADGTVIIHESADGQRRFQPDSRRVGAFFGQAGDTGTLKKTGGVLELKGAGGGVTRFLADGALDYIQDVNGNRITAGYVDGKLATLTHSAGGSLTIAYNGAGRISSLTESTGRVTTFAYDAANEHLLNVTGPDGTVTYAYDTGANPAKRHALTAVTDQTGMTTTFEYDAFGRLTAAQQPGGVNRVAFAPDANGGMTITDAAGVTSSAAYDHRGLLAKAADGAGSYVRYDYDAAGNLVKATDGLGRSVGSAWTAGKSLTTATDTLGATTKFSPGGPNNQPLSFTDANGNVTKYQYDAAGNLTATTYADGSVERAAHTAAGLAEQVTNRRGQAVTLAHNAAGQVTLETHADGGTVAYAYDAKARLETVTDAKGTTTFTYDPADRVTRIDYPAGRWLAYAYDAAGRRTRMEDHSGFVTKYGYDAAGRLTTLKDAADATLVTYAYDAAGRLTREDKGNGTATVNTYDAQGRIKTITNSAPGGAVNSRFEYVYDAQGRRTGMTTLDGSWTYEYDLAGQLIHAVFDSTNGAIPDQDITYEYDLLGNRTRTVTNGVAEVYAPNSMNQYATAGDKTFTYDRDGNLISETSPAGTKTYAYDAQNRLVRVQTPDGVTTYEYDSFGQRTATVVNGVRTEFLIDPFGLGEVVGEYDGAGARQTSYARGLGLEGVSAASGWNYYDFDAIGSTSGVSGAGGSYLDRYVYEPFGGSLLKSELTNNPYEYIGEYGVTTEATGLHYMRARSYDSVLGRFDNQDPLRYSAGDSNFYRYVSNQPTTLIDPEGTIRLFPDNSSLKVSLGGHLAIAPGLSFGRTMGYDSKAGYSAEWEGQFGGSVADIGVNVDVIYRNPTYTLSVGLNKYFSVNFGFDKSGLASYGVGIGVGVGVKFFPVNFLFPFPPTSTGKTSSNGLRAAEDPNEKFGAAGYGPQAYIPAGQAIPYRINFENLGPGTVPTPATPASAPAQRVEVTDQLSADLDWDTLAFTEFGFGDTVVTFDQPGAYQAATVPMTYNGTTFDVEVEMSIDPATGMVRVVYQSIDPGTFLPPDVLTGFLPPEDGTGRGKGHFAYRVTPKAGLPTGTAIRNVALISFDEQTIIATNQIDP